MIIREAIDRLLDSRFGVVRMLVEEPREPGSPEFFHYYAETCRTETFGGQENFMRGGGASVSREGAMAKALGEAIERYCGALYSRRACPLTSFDDAPFPCVDPSAFALYRDDQYASGLIDFVPFTKDLPVRWTRAVDVETWRETYVPAAMVFVPYIYRRADGEAPIMQPISTGLACHEGFERASLLAACEAIERDAFTIFWQARLPPPRVAAASLTSEHFDILSRFARARYEVTLFDVTTDVAVPSIMAVARHDDDSQPALVVAAATHPVASTAIRKSLEELEHTRSWCRLLKATTDLVDPAEGEGIASQQQHLRFWSERDNRQSAAWLFASDEERVLADDCTDDPTEQLDRLRHALQSAELRLLAADLTSPDIAQLGLSVVRAIIPGLHPLAIGHRNRVLGGRRLYEVPIRLGYGTPVFDLDDNANPHPFP